MNLLHIQKMVSYFEKCVHHHHHLFLLSTLERKISRRETIVIKMNRSNMNIERITVVINGWKRSDEGGTVREIGTEETEWILDGIHRFLGVWGWEGGKWRERERCGRV